MDMGHRGGAKTIKWSRGWMAVLLLWACTLPVAGVAAGAVRQAPAGAWGSGSGGVLQIAAGLDHSLALKADGTVMAWGSNSNGQLDIPEELSGVVAVATKEHYSLALKANGEVVAWGNGPATVPDEAKTGAVAIAVGNKHALALKSNGEVVAWGDDAYAQSTVPGDAKTGIMAIAAGALHSLALKATGEVVAWGLDNKGQSTVPDDAKADVIAIAAGAFYSLALKSNGEVVAWGDNSQNQAVVPDEAKTAVVAIAAGNIHSLALRSDGTVVAWGVNNHQQSEVPAGLNNVVAIAGGGVHSLALQSDGTIVGWGFDMYGQASSPFSLKTPVRAQAVAGGYAFSLALRSDGKVVAWGGNGSGQTNVPEGLSNVVAVSAGGDHSLALKSNGEVIAWGRTNEGQTAVPDAAKTNVVAIAAGYTYSLALKSDGEVMAWGNQSAVPADAKTGVVAIAAGRTHSLALKSNGEVVTWGGGPAVPADLDHVIAIAAGDGFSLALKSDGTVAAWGKFRNSTAVAVTPPAGLSGVVAIAAGDEHALALKLDGSIVSWGYDAEGQRSVPDGLHDVKMIYAGLNNSYALTADGTLTAWGKNSGGASDVSSVSRLNLALDAGALTPADGPDAYEYKYVGASATSVRITATLANPAAASLLVDVQAAVSGTAVEVPLSSSDAATTITVRTEPYLSSAVKTYTVKVYKDTTFPAISFDPDGSDDWSRSAATEITVSDAGGESGVDDATLRYVWTNSEDPPSESDWGDLFANGDTLTKNGADGDWYLHVRVSDEAGNETIAATKKFRLDNTGPGITVTMATYDLLAYTGDSWTNQAVYVHAEASDALSGEMPLSYSMDGGLSWALYSGDLVLNSDGVHSIHIKAVDAAGNETIEQRTVKISTSGLALTPTLTNVADGSDYTSGDWTNGSVTVSVYAQSGASGLGSLSYTLDEAPEQAYVNESPVTLDAEGAHTIVFKVSDTAGNTLDLPLKVNLDKTPPAVSFGTNGAATTAHSAATTATVSDGASGVNAATLQYKWKTTEEIEAVPTTDWTSFTNGTALSKQEDADGDWYLHIRAQDRAGNPVYAVSNRFRLVHATSDDSADSPLPVAETKPVIDLNGVTLDPATLDLEQPMITLEVTPSESGVAYVSLPAAILTDLADKNASLLFEIKTPYGSYRIPVNVASLIPGLQALLAANHLKAEDISFKITLTDKSADADIQAAVADGLPKGKVLGAIVDFSLEIVNAKTGQTIGTADRFSQALARMIPMPKGMADMPKLWGAYRYDEQAKKFEFVAATKEQIEGIWYVMIRSYSNSIYLVAENAVSFTDAVNHWSEPYVRLAAVKGLVAGVGDGRYAPDRAVTRAEFAAMLVRALGRNSAIDSSVDIRGTPTDHGVSGEGNAANDGADARSASSYTDVKQGAWYFAEVAAAKELGLLDFASGSGFKPNQPLTREEMASMLAAAVRMEQLPDTPKFVSLNGYKDIQSVGAAYLEDIRLMVKLGIMTGTGEDTFDPKGITTRAQAAVVFIKTLQALGLID